MEYLSFFDSVFKAKDVPEFLDIKFDFELKPNNFLNWAAAIGELDDGITEDYAFDCSSMCEFSCLYAAMLLHDTKLQGQLVIYNGYFGFFDHYWLGYTWKGQEYFIDLTLKQFVSNAPKLAISKAEFKPNGYRWYKEIKQETIQEYVERQHAFDFYLDPQFIY